MKLGEVAARLNRERVPRGEPQFIIYIKNNNNKPPKGGRVGITISRAN